MLGEEELVFIKVNNVPGTLHFIHSKQESCEVAKKKKKKKKYFPGGPMVRTPFPLQGAQVQFLIGEPRSHMPRGRAKNKIKKKKKEERQGRAFQNLMCVQIPWRILLKCGLWSLGRVWVLGFHTPNRLSGHAGVAGT